MRVNGLRQAECALQRDLPRRGIEQIGAANDLRDALISIIDDHSELIRVGTVGAFDDEVVDLAFDMAGEEIIESDLLIASAKSHRTRRAPESMLAATFVVRSGAGAVERESARSELVERCAIQIRTLRLPDDFAVPIESVALQRGENFFFRPADDARRIDVFDAHQPPPTRRACEEK